MSPGDPGDLPRATCVIVAFHRPAMTEKLIASLLNPLLEIVVVNVEDDPRIRVFEGVRVIPTVDNVGYAGGVNVGVRASRAPVTVFMNDDLEATADDVLRLVESIRVEEADAVLPLVEDSRGQLELGKRLPLGLAKRMLLQGMTVPTQPIRIDAAWAVFVAVRTDLVLAIPLPETYFLYWEEFEWFYRLRAAAAVVMLDPAVRVRHTVGLSSVRPDKSRLMARNAIRCVRRTRGRGAALRAWPVVVAWQLSLLIEAVVKLRVGELGAWCAGVWAGLTAWREI